MILIIICSPGHIFSPSTLLSRPGKEVRVHSHQASLEKSENGSKKVAQAKISGGFLSFLDSGRILRMEHTVFTKIEVTGFCWLWRGSVNNCGYGQVNLKGVKPAHRAVYELLVGPIPKGLQLDHLCHVRLCVNPDHLEPVTKSENMRRAAIRNGWVVGGKKYEKKPKSEWKSRPSVLNTPHCKNGHILAEVGIYEYTTAKGQHVVTCMACKKVSQCKANHVRTGCTPKCSLQTYPRQC